MRSSFLLPCLLLSAALAHAEPASTPAMLRVFEQAGIHLLCEQTEPMLLRGQDAAQHALLQRLFDPHALCRQLAERLAERFDAAQLAQMQGSLGGALAQRFTAAEREVGEQPQALAAYRERLQQQPVRGARLALIQRLDQAAHTTELASLLRYEVGKTQALLALLARGEKLGEQALQAQTQTQAEAIRQSSAQAVESFMLYAYRQVPSDQLAAYAALYEQPDVQRLLAASLETMPQLFSERREQLRKRVGKP
ncbi:hypothetical protein ACSVIJ_19895 [Pseudomonas sp. NCHU5208]|uniref:hypothetical protein n=1 Tax=unclassified Pseudomonas TaxID=196821 RepID=UPI003F97B2D8